MSLIKEEYKKLLNEQLLLNDIFNTKKALRIIVSLLSHQLGVTFGQKIESSFRGGRFYLDQARSSYAVEFYNIRHNKVQVEIVVTEQLAELDVTCSGESYSSEEARVTLHSDDVVFADIMPFYDILSDFTRKDEYETDQYTNMPEKDSGFWN